LHQQYSGNNSAKILAERKKVFLPGAETHLKVSYSIYYTPPSPPSRPDMEFQMLPETESTPTLTVDRIWNSFVSLKVKAQSPEDLQYNPDMYVERTAIKKPCLDRI
jgi:hypothetical protein